MTALHVHACHVVTCGVAVLQTEESKQKEQQAQSNAYLSLMPLGLPAPPVAGDTNGGFGGATGGYGAPAGFGSGANFGGAAAYGQSGGGLFGQ